MFICKLVGHKTSWGASPGASCRENKTCIRCGARTQSRIRHQWANVNIASTGTHISRKCHCCPESRIWTRYEYQELGCSFELESSWHTRPGDTADWRRNKWVRNPTVVDCFESELGTIEVIASDSWESPPSQLVRTPTYHRAMMRQHFLKKVLKEFSFKGVQYWARADTIPHFHEVRHKLPIDFDQTRYVPLYPTNDLCYGNILAVYGDQGSREWTVLSTIADRNIYFRYRGQMDIRVDEQLYTFLSSFEQLMIGADPTYSLWHSGFRM